MTVMTVKGVHCKKNRTKIQQTVLEYEVACGFLSKSFYNITISQYHNITVSQYQNITILQYYNITILQYHNITISQYHILFTPDLN